VTATALPLASRALPGSPASRAERQTALEALTTAGWPTRRREAWRYTDLAPLARTELELVPPEPGAAERALAASLVETVAAGAPRLVFVDGHWLREPGGSNLPGLDVRELDALAGGPAAPNAVDHPLAALNTAFAARVVCLRAEAAVPEPLHLVFVGSARAGLAPQPRLIIDLAPRAELTIVQHFVDAADVAGWVNAVVQVRQAEASRLKFLRLQEHGMLRVHTSLFAAELAAGAALEAGYFDTGGQLTRNDVDVELAEPGAEVSLFGLFLAGSGQHVDDHTRIDHAAGQTKSRETFRGIVGGRGRGVFNGQVIVRPGAQRIEARQNSDNLLLSNEAEIDTKPELQIYADDVKCTHGATVGEIDGEQLFYLRARGIDEQAARELLTVAFAETVLAEIADEDVRTRFAARVRARLAVLTEPR
jgi:Fe-S cluster assembly protein SufD